MRLAALPRRTRLLVLLLTAGLGGLLFLWRLGSTGLVDETPPLFAASARAMVERGDWLIPHVNGLPRYDKPPLVYWLMGLLYALPGQERWDPLGSWASSLPSALATIAVMLALADTLLRWPQPPGAEASRSGAAVDGAGPNAALQSAAVASAFLQPALTALAAPLAFALSPLILLWGRIPVSDALFTAMVSLTFLAVWRRLADASQPWALPWLLLGLAVLTKGPVAVVLLAFTLTLFALLQGQGRTLLLRLRPLPGLMLTAAVALPWYGLALWRDGSAFWDSFIGYHNLQRFTAVVNDHLEPWWFFAPVLVVAALPVTPLLLLGLARAVGPLRLRRWRGLPLPAAAWSVAPELSLARFAACWLLAILLFFTAAATKLPSYWLPATPAAALLIALVSQWPWHPAGDPTEQGPTGALPPDPAPQPKAGLATAAPFTAASSSEAASVASAASSSAGASRSVPEQPLVSAQLVSAQPCDVEQPCDAEQPAVAGRSPGQERLASHDRRPDRAFRLAWRLSLLLAAVLALAFAVAPLWVPLIFDPEMPTLPAELLASGFLVRAAWLWALAALLGWILRARPAPLRLLALQLPLVLFVPAALLPSWALGDRLRGLPVRQMAAAATRLAAPREPLAMVGILKPSLHYYSGRVVIYEGIEPEGLVNLADRLRHERRPGQHPAPPSALPTVLVVIDRTTAASSLWQGLQPVELSRAGLYRLWRLDRERLERRAAALRAAGHPITWTRPRPERY
jgi:4-amino-4-deoxy-L-arabinose transferase-like glycosyltransferase